MHLEKKKVSERKRSLVLVQTAMDVEDDPLGVLVIVWRLLSARLVPLPFGL